jgi:glucose/arabinose dehydrogenase
MRMRWWLLLLILGSSLADGAGAQLVRAERVAAGFSRPVILASPPGESGRLFVAEQHTGLIRSLDPVTGEIAAEPLLDIDGLAQGGEQGLLGLAFHPRFAENGLFYVNLTRSGDGATVIRRYALASRDPDRAGPQGFDLLVIAQPQSNHNGGWIGFGPADDYLYIATGDGGSGDDSGFGHTEPGGNAQDLTDNLLGKILRIDVDADDDFPSDPLRNYAIPPDNPFVGADGDDEIWAYGLRNPFRCSFDTGTAALYCGDVGQLNREEIDYQPPGSRGGENYGWRLREGTIATPTGGVGGEAPGAIDPIFDYPRTGEISGNVVTGGVVYRGPAPGLRGLYFFADFGRGRIWSLRFDGSDPADFDGTNYSEFIDWSGQPGFLPQAGQGNVAWVSTFGQDGAGNVYFANLFDGEVFAIGVDSDADGRIDPRDRCPFFASADQTDSDGNGIGDECECGDQTGDGRVDVNDLLAIQQAIFKPALVTPLCDASGDGLCSVSDLVAANQRIFGAPAYCSRNPPPLP